MFSKIKERWGHISDGPEDTKIFSKEWFVFVLILLGIVGVIALIVLICHFFKLDSEKIDDLFNLLAFGAFSFFMGTMFGVFRADKHHQKESKNKPK